MSIFGQNLILDLDANLYQKLSFVNDRCKYGKYYISKVKTYIYFFYKMFTHFKIGM